MTSRKPAPALRAAWASPAAALLTVWAWPAAPLAAQTVAVNVRERARAATAPILLEGLSVPGDQRCRIGVEGGLAVSRVWDEARKALTATTLTDEQRRYRYQTMIYEQDLDRDTRLVRRTRESRREANLTTPFESRPIDQLMAHGHVEPSGAADLYDAPDARVLLSEPFLDAHCFRTRAGSGGETRGLVGLSFEPTSDRRSVVEVAGTLWLAMQTTTNEQGFYVVCRVPENQRFEVVTVVDGLEGVPDEHRIDEARGILEHSVRVVRSPGR